MVRGFIQLFIDSSGKGAMAASHILEANTLKGLYDKLLDLCVTDKLMNGIPIGLLRAT